MLGHLSSPHHIAAYRATRHFPAHAGKSVFSNSLAIVDGDHPRTCGEKTNIILNALIIVGSPPHMRGKALSTRYHTPFSGITPAHAGKSCLHSLPCQPRQDHPRTCGEKLILSPFSASIVGSPPHMRGKAESSARRPNFERITPAHAGKR